MSDLKTLDYAPERDRLYRMKEAASEMYDELYETLQLLLGKSSYEGDEFFSQAMSIKELMTRIDGEGTEV